MAATLELVMKQVKYLATSLGGLEVLSFPTNCFRPNGESADD